MHPDGYHKSESARLRCWGCSHPELLEWTEEEMSQARQLVTDGWIAISNKYRIAAKLDLPPFDRAVKLSPDLPTWAARAMKEVYGNLHCEFGARMHGKQQTLAPGVYRAFKFAERTTRNNRTNEIR